MESEAGGNAVDTEESGVFEGSEGSTGVTVDSGGAVVGSVVPISWVAVIGIEIVSSTITIGKVCGTSTISFVPGGSIAGSAKN